MEKQSGPSGLFRYARYINLPIQFIAVFGIFGFAGHWVDGKLGTRPWLFLVGAAVGFGAAFYNLYREVYGEKRGG